MFHLVKRFMKLSAVLWKFTGKIRSSTVLH
jgi:hypothetical protein